MEAKPYQHPVFQKDQIAGFDFEKMVVLRWRGYHDGPDGILPFYSVEPITATQMQNLTDCFQDDLVAGRT